VALNAHVAAVIRSLRCFLISVGRISARAPQTAPLFQSRTETSTPVFAAECAAPHAFRLVLIACALFALLFVAARFSPLNATFFACVCVRFYRFPVARARSAFLCCACARARPLSPAPMRPIQPCSAHSISYACPRSRGVHAFSAQSVHEMYSSDLPFVSHFPCLCLQCASRCSAHRLSCSTRRPRCSGVHLLSMSALELQCALLDLWCAPLDLHRAPLDLQCVSLGRSACHSG
jgi:hypothetical protein